MAWWDNVTDQFVSSVPLDMHLSNGREDKDVLNFVFSLNVYMKFTWFWKIQDLELSIDDVTYCMEYMYWIFKYWFSGIPLIPV